MRAIPIACALMFAACEAVPDPTFAAGDASTDDAGGNTCPGQVPPYASLCCGPIACSGPNCVVACNDCESRCALAELCCPNAQSHANCRAGTTCP